MDNAYWMTAKEVLRLNAVQMAEQDRGQGPV